MVSSRNEKPNSFYFYLYLVFLTWGILFKFEWRPQDTLFFLNYRSVNWVPFAEPLMVNGEVIWLEPIFNLLVFVPFSILLTRLKPDWSSFKVIGAGCLLSLTYEALQYILAIGVSDITDVLMNSLGVLLDLVIARNLKKYLERSNDAKRSDRYRRR